MKADWDAVELHLAQQIYAESIQETVQRDHVDVWGEYKAKLSFDAAAVFVKAAKERYAPKPEPAKTPAAEPARKILRQEDLKPETTTASAETVYNGASPVAQFVDQTDKAPVPNPDSEWRAAQVKATKDMIAKLRAEKVREQAELDEFFRYVSVPPDPFDFNGTHR